jgi:hypothetical protein
VETLSANPNQGEEANRFRYTLRWGGSYTFDPRHRSRTALVCIGTGVKTSIFKAMDEPRAPPSQYDPLTFIFCHSLEQEDQNDPTVKLVKKIYTTLRDFVQNDNQNSIPDTAGVLLELVPDPNANSNHDGAPEEGCALWNMVIHVAQQIPHNDAGMIRLVWLVDELFKSPKAAVMVEIVRKVSLSVIMLKKELIELLREVIIVRTTYLSWVAS